MDIAELVYKYGTQYEKAYNRHVTAKSTLRKLCNDRNMQDDLRRKGLAPYIDENDAYTVRAAKTYFIKNNVHGSNREYCYLAFPTVQARTARVAYLEFRLYQAMNQAFPTNKGYIVHEISPEAIENAKNEINLARIAPVYKELGKQWKAYVASIIEQKKAKLAYHNARCAITGFNAMDFNMKIKFGSLNPGKGSLSRIRCVLIDNQEITWKAFKLNYKFESAILAAE